MNLENQKAKTIQTYGRAVLVTCSRAEGSEIAAETDGTSSSCTGVRVEGEATTSEDGLRTSEEEEACMVARAAAARTAASRADKGARSASKETLLEEDVGSVLGIGRGQAESENRPSPLKYGSAGEGKDGAIQAKLSE